MISFSPPDITQDEIDEVIDALKSGWITTGPKTKQLENDLAAFCNTSKVACLSSATAAMECALRLLGIGPGDEVITSAYTYTASASPICHVGATPVLVDVAPDSYEMDLAALADAVTERTRAVIPVDIAGRMVDYDSLFEVIGTLDWHPGNLAQERIGHLPVVADGAHSLGALYHGMKSGQVADITTFSFHAVKNFTTAEGGALTWAQETFEDSEQTYHELMLLSLHGQTKDALAKTKASAWEYDVAFPGWKCNMTDIQAGMGLAQLRRYPGMLEHRQQMIAFYEELLKDAHVDILQHRSGDPYTTGFRSSGHLMLVRLMGHTRDFRDRMIERLAEEGVSSNVHYKPLPLLTAYRDLGFDPIDYPHAIAQFENEITLPLHTLLTDADIEFICAKFYEVKQQMEKEGFR